MMSRSIGVTWRRDIMADVGLMAPGKQSRTGSSLRLLAATKLDPGGVIIAGYALFVQAGYEHR